VAVQADQLQVRRRGENPANRLGRFTSAQREAELLVLVGRRDELVGVCLDADGHAHHDPRGDAEPPGDGGEPVDLVERVDDDPADAVPQRRVQLRHRLVVAVQAESLPRHTGPHGHRELAAGADVEPQIVVADPAGHLRAEEGLARVVDVGAAAEVAEHLGVGVAEVASPGPEVGLVEEVCRCAELAGQVLDGDTPDGELTVGAAAHGGRPE
jgi:hypothetical protein